MRFKLVRHVVSFIISQFVLGFCSYSTSIIDVNISTENSDSTPGELVIKNKVINKKTIQNRGIIRIENNILENRGTIHNYNTITGNGTIINKGLIYNYNSYVEDTSINSQDYTIIDYDYSKLVTAEQIANAALYDFANTFSVETFKKKNKANIDNTIIINETPVVEKLDTSEFFQEESKVKAFFVEEGDTMEVTPDDGNKCYASFYSIKGYSGKIGEVPDVSKTTILKKTKPGKIVFMGDNSWYNGVFNMTSGTSDIHPDAAIFGGDVNLYGSSILIWRGGAKDPYNKPTISLYDLSELHFELQTAERFSVYGKIFGQENSTVYFDNGIVYIKSDCSGFMGNIVVADGAKFVIRTDIGESGQHYGKMFSGKFKVKNSGSVTIDTSQGLEPLSVEDGSVTIVNTENENLSSIKGLTVGESASVIVDLKNAELTDVIVKGNTTLNHDSTINNLDVDNGFLKFNAKTLNLKGKTIFGSYFDSIDGIISTINVDSLEIREGHSLNWYLDFDPQTGECDKMNVKEGKFPDSSSLKIDDYELLSEPTEKSYTFQILDVENNIYPKIEVNNEKEIQGALGIYKLYSEGGNGKVVLRLDNATVIDPEELYGLNEKQLDELNNKIIYAEKMHNSDIFLISLIHNLVYANSEKYKDENKCKIWHKSYIRSSEYDNIKFSEKVMAFGADTNLNQMKNKFCYYHTFFAAYSLKNLRIDSKKTDQENCTLGYKFSIINDKNSAEFLATYTFLNSSMKNGLTDVKPIKSGIIGLGTKLSRNIKLSQESSFVPSVSINYGASRSHNIKTESVAINNKHKHEIDVSPSIKFVHEKEKSSLNIEFRWYQKILNNMKSYVNKHKFKPSRKSKNCFETSFEVRRKNIMKTFDIGLRLSKIFGKSKEMKAEIHLSVTN